MTNYKSTLLVIVLMIISLTATCQDNYLEITNYNINDSNLLKIDTILIKRHFDKNSVSKLIFSKLLNLEKIDSIFKSSKTVFCNRIFINDKIVSLLYLNRIEPDTLWSLKDIQIRMYLYNFDTNKRLISSALIARYDDINDGFSHSGMDTELTFKNNLIYIKEIHNDYPTDMIVKFKVNKNTFKTIKIFQIKMSDKGRLSKEK